MKYYGAAKRAYNTWQRKAAAHERAPAKRRRTSSSMARTVRRRGVRTRTMGRYAGKFKKARMFKQTKYSRGVIANRELNGVVNNTGHLLNPVVVGHHSMPKDDVVYVCLFSMLKMIAKEAGYGTIEYKDRVATALVSGVIPTYIRGVTNDGVKKTTTVNATFDATWDDLVTGYITDLTNNWSGSDEINQFNIHIPNSDDGSRLEINTSQIRLSVYVKSVLKIQNRTLASSVAGNTDADNANNIANNPLIGRKYGVNGSRFAPLLQYGAGAAFDAATNGLLSNDWSRFTDGNDLQHYRHFVSPSQFKGRVTATGCRLQPGQIKHDTLVLRKTMTFAQLFDFKKQFEQRAGWYGRTNMFWFEKEIETGVDEPIIEIGYQLDTHMGATCYMQKPLSRPISF